MSGFLAALKCTAFDDCGPDDFGQDDSGLDGFLGGLFGVRMNAPLWLSDHLIAVALLSADDASY